MNIPIKGISIFQTDEVIHIESKSALITLSSAIVGGGFGRVCHIINANVDKNFYCKNPGAWLRSFARDMKI